MRHLIGQRSMEARAIQGSTLEDLLRKFFNYVPELREHALQPASELAE